MNPRLYERLYGLRLASLVGLVAIVAICVGVALGGPLLNALLKPVAPTPVAPTPVAPTPVAPTPVPPTPVPPTPVPPTPVPPTPVPPTPVAPTPVAPTPVPPTPVPPTTPTPPWAAAAAQISHRRTVSGIYTVQWGDCLAAIAADLCSSWSKWAEIYNANGDKVVDPRLIFPGQELLIPCTQ
jgi:nucleoid-associated protein YgaU